MFEVLKFKFNNEGLFDIVNKCVLFECINCIGVIILLSGVVFYDVLSVLKWCSL